jgi:peptide deformylase
LPRAGLDPACRFSEEAVEVAVREILLLGNPQLHEASLEVQQGEIPTLAGIIQDLHDTMMDFRVRHGLGRAIAAPQIGVMKRIVYMNTGEPVVFLNPRLTPAGNETMEVWDDCMSFPELLVRVERHRACRVEYLDQDWNGKVMDLEGDLSELLQHECDHLDGILATERAMDSRSFALRGSTSRFPRRTPRGR